MTGLTKRKIRARSKEIAVDVLVVHTLKKAYTTSLTKKNQHVHIGHGLFKRIWTERNIIT
jgi:hypothetical protein